MWWGKIIGFIVGHALAGAFGAVIGLLIGHIWDLYRSQRLGFSFGQTHSSIQQMRQSFFDTTFLVMGYVAKADGHVSEQELEAARKIMQRMVLNEEQKKDAMRLFNEGKKPDFNLEYTLSILVQVCRGNFIMLQMFADLQMQAAKMSGPISSKKQHVLDRIFQRLGYVPFEVHFQHFQGFYQGQHQHRQHGFQSQPAFDKVKEAYQLLGIPETATTAEIKRAYRKLISQHHPDKLFAKGLPEEMMKIATEKAQDIQLAYDLLRKVRGF